MSPTIQRAYMYARGESMGSGSEAMDRLHAWTQRHGLAFSIDAAVSGPGYVVRIVGDMPEPELDTGGERYWYPDRLTLVQPRNMRAGAQS